MWQGPSPIGYTISWAGGLWLIRKLVKNEPVSKLVCSISLWFLYQVPALSSGLDLTSVIDCDLDV